MLGCDRLVQVVERNLIADWREELAAEGAVSYRCEAVEIVASHMVEIRDCSVAALTVLVDYFVEVILEDSSDRVRKNPELEKA